MNLRLKPSLIREALVRCMFAGVVPLVCSSPGMGKSEIVHSIGKEYRLKVIDFRLGQADITDLNGLPRFTDEGRAEFAPFDTFPLEGDELPKDEDGNDLKGWLLFFDEANVAPKQVQAAAYKILLERMVGHNKLHKNVVMMCAGNLDTDRAVTHSLSTALQSRLIHLEMELSKKEWINWAVDNQVDSRILAFIEFKPDLLHNFKPDHSDKTFACPRTWVFTSKLIKDEVVTNGDLPLLAGTIGPGPAQEFLTFTQVYETLPKMREIVASPAGVVIPTDPATKFALAAVVAEYFNEKEAEPLVTLIQRLPVESRVLCMRMIRRRDGQLLRLPVVAELFQGLINYL